MVDLEITNTPIPAENSGEGATKVSSNAGVYFRRDKYLIAEFVRILRRAFRYNSAVINKGLEYLNFSSGSMPSVYEAYADIPESYPRIIVMGLGGTNSGVGFNHFTHTYVNDSYDLGCRGLAYENINANNNLLFRLPDLENNTLNALQLSLGWSGVGLEDNINIKVYENYASSPSLVASGSLIGFSDLSLKLYRIPMHPQVVLAGDSNWVELSCSASIGGYNVGIDTEELDLAYAVNNLNSIQTGSVVGRAILPPFLRFGGNRDSTISIRCLSKNNSNQARDLADATESLLYALSQGKISREAHAVEGVELTRTKSGVQSEWEIKDIYVKLVRQGALELRERGDNDKIYIVPLFVDVFSSWFRDYPVYDLDKIILEMDAY